MATILSNCLIVLFFTFFFFFSNAIVNGRPKTHSKENLTHLHFYFHDFVKSSNPTAVRVAEAPITNTSSTMFGVVMVADNPLTETAKLSSKPVGRAECLYASASQKEVSLLMAINLVFTEGKYNGSTLTILGRNAVLSSKVREMPVVGGTGVFRLARGYLLASTHTFDATTLNAIVEFNVHVLLD